MQEDWDKVTQALSPNFLMEELEKSGRYLVDYRTLDGTSVRFTRMNVIWAKDKMHLIFGVEDVDEEMRRETARTQAMQAPGATPRPAAVTRGM